MAALKAMPGIVILKFPRAPEKLGNIVIPQTSQMRPEFPMIYSMGVPLTFGDLMRWWTLRKLKKAGIPVAVSFASGVSYWKDNYDTAYAWLKDFRAYTFREIAACLVDDDEVAERMGR